LTPTPAAEPRRTAKAQPAAELVDALLPRLREWLPERRWFAGKGSPIIGLGALSVTELTEGPPGGGSGTRLLHLLLRVEQRDRAAGQADVYQLLLGAASEPPAGLPAEAVIARDPAGVTLYDALHDPVGSTRLLDLLATADTAGPASAAGSAADGPSAALGATDDQGSAGGAADAAGGPGGASRGAGAAGVPAAPLRVGRPAGARVPTGLEPRLGTAEQSNTSVVYGDALILKVFRRVSPGLNPDLELTRALAQAGSTRVPAPLAWLETAPGPGCEPPATLALLQRFLAGGRDGWEFALERGRELAVGDREDPSPTGNFAAEAFLLGRATAEVHLTLARALPVAILRAAQTDQLVAGMCARLDAAAEAVPALREYRSALRAIFHDLSDRASDGRTLRLQRVHGDLHLGQSMRTPDGWVLLDFEGEPATPLAERRRPQPAARDVAAMLRSFDYAAAHLLAEDHPDRPTAGLEHRAARWAARNRDAFCAGYAAAGGTDPREDAVLLRAMETDKAVYEVVYEARNRPAWLPIPLAAIRRLTAERAERGRADAASPAGPAPSTADGAGPGRAGGPTASSGQAAREGPGHRGG